MNYVPLRKQTIGVLNTDGGGEMPDWGISYNTPPNVDAFNHILSSEVSMLNKQSSSNVSFYDMSDIVGPMWDSAMDFNHHNGIVGRVMANKLVCSLYPPPLPSAATSSPSPS